MREEKKYRDEINKRAPHLHLSGLHHMDLLKFMAVGKQLVEIADEVYLTSEPFLSMTDDSEITGLYLWTKEPKISHRSFNWSDGQPVATCSRRISEYYEMILVSLISKDGDIPENLDFDVGSWTKARRYRLK